MKTNFQGLSLIYNNAKDFMGLIKVDKNENLIIESINEPYLNYLIEKDFLKKGQSLTGLSIKVYFRDILKMPTEGLNKRISLLNSIKYSTKALTYETHIPLTNGQQDIFNITLTPIFEEGESVASIIIFVLNDITLQKKATEKVIESEKQLSMVFNGSKDMFFIFDVRPGGALIFTNANDAFTKRVTELTQKKNIESLYGQELFHFLQNFKEHSVEDIKEKVRIAYKAIQTKKPYEYPGFFIDHQGNKYLSEVTITPIFNQEGVCEKLFYTSRDVTQKVVAQKALETSEKRLSTIYNASLDVIGLIRLNTEGDYEIESVNQLTIDLLKSIESSEPITYFQGMKMRYLFENIFDLPQTLVEERMNMLTQVFTKNKTFKYKSPFQPKGSNLILDFETVVSPIINSEGICTHALYTARDITESEKAKSKLLFSQKRQDSIFNGASDQMAILDVLPDGDIIFENSNLSFQKSWKITKIPYNVETIYGRDIKYCLTKILHFSEVEANHRIAICKQIIQDKKSFNYEELFIGFDNKKYFLDVTISAILDKEDNCKKLLFILRDITLKHKARERMISKILETEDRERSRFAKELHDSLGQNLTVASLNFNIVKKDISNLNKNTQEKFDAGYNFLKEAIQESRNIAHNLMPQSISDFGYVLAIESLIENLAQTTEIEFNFYDNLTGNRLAVDHELSLYRVTQEAINNILKHSDATVVSIQLIKHAKSIILTIEDNGKGFLIESHKGNSFGLNSMRNRASALSGLIDIDSAPEKGTSITLEIPT